VVGGDIKEEKWEEIKSNILIVLGRFHPICAALANGISENNTELIARWWKGLERC